MLNKPTLNCSNFKTSPDRTILIIPLFNIFLVKKTYNKLDLFPKFTID